VLIARQPRSPAAYWRGRQTLSLLDAILWPLGLVCRLHALANDTGWCVTVVVLALVVTVPRCRRALFDNAAIA
jgi:hypothetical protein